MKKAFLYIQIVKLSITIFLVKRNNFLPSSLNNLVFFHGFFYFISKTGYFSTSKAQDFIKVICKSNKKKSCPANCTFLTVFESLSFSAKSNTCLFLLKAISRFLFFTNMEICSCQHNVRKRSRPFKRSMTDVDLIMLSGDPTALLRSSNLRETKVSINFPWGSQLSSN